MLTAVYDLLRLLKNIAVHHDFRMYSVGNSVM